MYIIKRNRIRSGNYFGFLKNNSQFVLKTLIDENQVNNVQKMGITDLSSESGYFLPLPYNKYAAKNAELYYTIDKTRPMETYYQTVYWTRHEWAGRDCTREVSEFMDFERKRYPRIKHLPYSVEFSMVNDGGKMYIVSDKLVYSKENMDCIINTANMLLSLFGECEIVSDIADHITRTRNVPWHILPPGEHPWSSVKSVVEQVATKYNNTQKQMMLRNCEHIIEYNPDFVAYGKEGFNGYVVFGFNNQHIYVLESIIPNNATYIFGDGWESFSQLTKDQILTEKLQKARICHNQNWKIEFDKYMTAT